MNLLLFLLYVLTLFVYFLPRGALRTPSHATPLHTGEGSGSCRSMRLTATGGGYPVKGIIRLATLENLMFVFNLVSYFYLLFILLAPTPSWKLWFLFVFGLSLPRGEGNFTVYFGVVGLANYLKLFTTMASYGKSVTLPLSVGRGRSCSRRMRRTNAGEG